MTQTATDTPRDIPQPLGPDSYTWQDFGSWRFHLMLPQAFVLQVAHPIIDAGVGEHSVYKTDPWGRAKRSTELLWPIVYARPQKAIEMGIKLRDLHRTIKGVDKHGNKYFALDPEAYSWVHITGYDATIRMHEMLGKSPTAEQRRAMFVEWRQLGKMMGIRDQDLPATESDYWDYFHGIIRDRLEWGEVVEDLMRPDHYLEIPKPPGSRIPDGVWRLILAVMGRFMRFNLRATLPHPFWEKFHIPWSKTDQRLFRVWCGVYRVLHALTPRKRRLIPLARKAYQDAERHPDAYHLNTLPEGAHYDIG